MIDDRSHIGLLNMQYRPLSGSPTAVPFERILQLNELLLMLAQVLRVLSRDDSMVNCAPPPPAALQPPLPTPAGTSRTAGSGAACANAAAALSRKDLWQGSNSPGLAASPVAMGSDGLVGSQGLGGSLHQAIDVNQLATELSTHLAIDQINSPQARCDLLPRPDSMTLMSF